MLFKNNPLVYFLLGISPASNCIWPTFRNPVSIPSSKAGCTVYTVHPAFEDGTDTGFRNVGQLQFDAGKYPEENIQNSGSFLLFLKHKKQEKKSKLHVKPFLNVV